MQRQKRKPSKEDSIGFPASKHHKVEFDSPTSSQQPDNMDVFEDYSGESMDVPFVALHCHDHDSGVKDDIEDEEINVHDDSTVLAVVVDKCDREEPLKWDNSVQESTYNAQHTVETKDDKLVSDCDDTELSPADHSSLHIVQHDHSYVCIPPNGLVAGRVKSIKLSKTMECSGIVDCGDEEGIDKLCLMGNEAVSDEGDQSVIVECTVEHCDVGLHLEEELSDSIQCDIATSPLTHSTTLGMTSVDVLNSEEDLQLHHEEGSVEVNDTKTTDVAVVNLEETEGSSAFKSDDDTVKLHQVYRNYHHEVQHDTSCQYMASCIEETKSIHSSVVRTHGNIIGDKDNDAASPIEGVTIHGAIKCDTFLQARDSCSQVSQQCEEKSRMPPCQDNLALSPMQTNNTILLTEEEASQELFSEPASMEEPHSNKSAETHQCSAVRSGNPMLSTGNEQQQKAVSSKHSSMEQQSLFSTSVSSVMSAATEQDESPADHHDFSSLAQLTTDNLELLESNLQHIVPSAVGHRLYQMMIKVMSRFPEYFEKS